MKRTFVLAFTLFAFCANAQSLTGTWLSYYYRDKPGDKRLFFYRLYLKHSADSLYGICEALDIQADTRGLHPKDATVTARQMVYNHAFKPGGEPGFRLHTGPASKTGIGGFFAGGQAPLFQTLVCRVVSKGMPFHAQLPIIYSLLPVSDGPVGELQMQKVSDSIPDLNVYRNGLAGASKAPAAKRSVPRPTGEAPRGERPAAPAPPVADLPLEKRSNDVQAVIETASERVKLQLFDNGIVDNDTVSLYLNGQPLVVRQRISAQPLTLDVPLQPGTENTVLLFAHNLGNVPPNTALLLVTAGEKQYRVALSGTLQKNATVVFKASGKKAK